MRLFKMKNYAILIALITVFAACSSDDDGGSNSSSNGNAGDPHHYDLAIGMQNYEGDVDNIYGTDGENGAVSAVSEYTEVNGQATVVFSLQNNDMLITGGFKYPVGGNENVAINDTDSFMSIVPGNPLEATGYDSESGSATVTIGEKISFAPGSGTAQFAELFIEFSGTFTYDDENGEEQTKNIAGSFKINLPPGY